MIFVAVALRKCSALAGTVGFRRLLRLMVVIGLTLPVAACLTFDSMDPSSWFGEKYEMKVIDDVPPAQLYDEGLAGLQKRDYDLAAKKFSALEKQDPYSQWQRKALLMTAFSQYKDGKYNDAIGTAQRYIKLFVKAPDLDYAYYIQAMSYYNQIPDITRDQDRAEKASKVFAELIEKFPKSEYAEDARYKLQVTRDQLAGRDMMVGRFYLQHRNFPGAISRFREVLAKYQTTRHAEEALMRLTEAYLALGIVNEAQTAAAVLGHNFPDSAWYKDAYARLKEGGLEPHEDQGSWISKTFHKLGVG
jgi:outer membrane protein assembly factor BamD